MVADERSAFDAGEIEHRKVCAEKIEGNVVVTFILFFFKKVAFEAYLFFGRCLNMVYV